MLHSIGEFLAGAGGAGLEAGNRANRKESGRNRLGSAFFAGSSAARALAREAFGARSNSAAALPKTGKSYSQ